MLKSHDAGYVRLTFDDFINLPSFRGRIRNRLDLASKQNGSSGSRLAMLDPDPDGNQHNADTQQRWTFALC